MPLGRWRERSEIGDDALGVFSAHAKLRHGRPQPLAIAPDASGQKLDHVRIAAPGRTCDSWRLERPIGHRTSRQQPQGRAFQPLSPLQLACAISGSMTLAANSHVFHNVFAASYQRGIISSTIRRWLSVLRPALVSQHRNEKDCKNKCDCARRQPSTDRIEEGQTSHASTSNLGGRFS